MLIKIFTETLMIFLITYALMDILCRFIKFLLKRSEQKQLCGKLLIYCESEENIENLVRSSLETAHVAKCELILVLKKETHESELITNQLKHEFPYLKIIKFSDDTLNSLFGETAP